MVSHIRTGQPHRAVYEPFVTSQTSSRLNSRVSWTFLVLTGQRGTGGQERRRRMVGARLASRVTYKGLGWCGDPTEIRAVRTSGSCEMGTLSPRCVPVSVPPSDGERNPQAHRKHVFRWRLDRGARRSPRFPHGSTTRVGSWAGRRRLDRPEASSRGGDAHDAGLITSSSRRSISSADRSCPSPCHSSSLPRRSSL